jgi:putative ABC transport system permease protein
MNRWSTTSFATLINVGRSKRNNQFFMMFLVLTISIGIFNVSIARTINTNMQDSLRYMTGADIVVKPYWDTNKDSKNEDFIFSSYSKLPGVNMATKIFRTNEAECDSGFYIYNDIYLMGIIPHEFGKVAWMQGELLYPHWNWYLNILTRYPNAVLMSNFYREKYNLKIGGPVEISLKSGEKFNGIIGGFIDYWPTVNPNNINSKYFVIANLNYLQNHLSINSYEVWIKTDTQTSIKKIYDEINRKELPLEEIQDIKGGITNLKNEPLLQGTNGSLTVGFISIVIMMILGFLIYWILSIKDRQLEFGILRALGLPLKKIMVILVGENLLTSGISVIAGTIIGKINTKISTPLIDITSNLSKQALPFKIVSYSTDYTRLYAVVGIILILGLIVLIKYVRKIRIDQAIKLGED